MKVVGKNECWSSRERMLSSNTKHVDCRCSCLVYMFRWPALCSSISLMLTLPPCKPSISVLYLPARLNFKLLALSLGLHARALGLKAELQYSHGRPSNFE